MRACKADSDAKAYFERTFPEILTQAVKDGLEAAIPLPQGNNRQKPRHKKSA